MASPIDDLQKVRIALVELRRREAAMIANGQGELPTYAAGIFNTMNWIGAVDRAIDDERKLASGPAVAAGGRRRPVADR